MLKSKHRIIHHAIIKKHKSFFRGIIAGIAIVAVIDLSIVHLWLKAHRSFSHPSVDIVEPIVVIIAAIILIYISAIEFQKK